MAHYVEVNRRRMADPTMLPRNMIAETIRSGRIFLGVEANDAMLPQELALLGDGQILYSSDFPHGEGRDEAPPRSSNAATSPPIKSRRSSTATPPNFSARHERREDVGADSEP